MNDHATFSDEVAAERVPYSPADGIPAPLTRADELRRFIDALGDGSGPVAIDAERASGFRYSQRAYLIQIRREGAGTALIDPLHFSDLSALAAPIASEEWILHAATQDLPCLAEVGMRPTRLFDTELAGRLLGSERVNLAALVDEHLGHYLPKGHGATDWSQRPFTDEQLQYAALDVELLIPLRHSLQQRLLERNLWQAAEEEFATLVHFTPKERGPDPWRRTSGMHKVRSPRAMAVLRELWEVRDAIARETDRAPGRVIPDAALVAIAVAAPASRSDFESLPESSRVRGVTRHRRELWSAIERAHGLSAEDLPRSESRGLPAPRIWKDRNPDAWSRLDRARAALSSISETTHIPVENLLSPEALRYVCWHWPADQAPDRAAVAAALRDRGARSWQCSLVSDAISNAWQSVDERAI